MLGDEGAAAVDIPAPPTTFGQRRFTLALPDAYDFHAGQSRYEINAAGAGFVVLRDLDADRAALVRFLRRNFRPKSVALAPAANG